jgi:hypothetical protein
MQNHPISILRPAILISSTLVASCFIARAQVVAPAITRHPAAQSRSLGDTVRLSVLFSSDVPATFQWLKDGQEVPSGTNSLLTLADLKAADAGTYTVRVSNESGAVSSNPAKVEVDATFVMKTDTPITKDAGSSMAWGDYDGDGRIDLLCSGAMQPSLYHNEGGGQFVKVGGSNVVAARTYQHGNGYAAWVDFDNDGLRDVFIGTGQNPGDEPDYLFRNLGGGSFVQVTNALTRRSVSSMSATWADFNRDGRLDVFFGNVTGSLSERANELWLAQPDATFLPAAAVDFPGLNRRNFGSVAVDYDLDGDEDVLVATNPGGLVIAYDNQGSGAFDAINVGGNGSYIGSMGAGDYDNDGLPDLYVAYGGGVGRLLHNDGGGSFSDAAPQPLLAEPGRSTCGTWGDYDNDGWLDLFVARKTTYTPEGSKDDSLWRNLGDGTFERVPAGSVGIDAVDTHGAAWGDFDDDGFLDLALACDSRNRLYRNNGNGNAWIQLKLVGTLSNREAIGSRVRLKAAIGAPGDRRRTQFRQVIFTSGWASQNDLRVHFGLAEASQADEIEITWPGGQVTTLRNVPARRILTVTEPDQNVRLTVRRVPQGGGPGTLELSLAGPAGAEVVVERTSDFRAWTEASRVTLDSAGAGVVLAEVAASGPGFFRTRRP